MRDALGNTGTLRVVALRAHETAARLAARDDPLLRRLTDAEPGPATAEPADP